MNNVYNMYVQQIYTIAYSYQSVIINMLQLAIFLLKTIEYISYV